MSPSSQMEKVLIVGAGIGGLALAQNLRKANVSYEIFERDENPVFRRQGWAVALVECLPDLAELLPDDLGDLGGMSVNAGTGLEDTLSVVHPTKGHIIATIGGAKAGQPGHIIRANRPKMREYLWQHIPVRTGKVFSHYAEDKDSVTVFFKDGSSARGSMLVGADGARSRVRDQLLGGNVDDKDKAQSPSSVVLSRWVSIMGEARMPLDVFQEHVNRGASAALLAAEDTRRMTVGLQGISEDGKSMQMYFGYCFKSDDPAVDVAWVAAASARSLANKVADGTRDWAPWLTEVVRRAGEEGIVRPPITLVEWVPPAHRLPRSRVTLLGDAAHTMIPFRGAGANCAVLDACDMTRALIAGIQIDDSVDAILAEYESKCLPRGRRMVLASRAAGENSRAVIQAFKGRTINLGKGRMVKIETDEDLEKLMDGTFHDQLQNEDDKAPGLPSVFPVKPSMDVRVVDRPAAPITPPNERA